MSGRRKPENIDEYISLYSGEARGKLEELRRTVRRAAPDATETISYGIPTFKLHGFLVHFAAYKDHVSLFPTSSGVRVFKKELTRYKTAPGTVQFPLGEPLPLDLVRRIVEFRVKEVTRPRKGGGGESERG